MNIKYIFLISINQSIMEDPVAYRRVLKSYTLMLDFYGMELADEKTGQIKRSEGWRPRFHNLNT